MSDGSLVNYFFKLFLGIFVADASKVCANACVIKDYCFGLHQWFICDHYQCVNTSMHILYCIECGEKTFRKGMKDVLVREMITAYLRKHEHF